MSKRLSIGAAFLLGTSTFAATALIPTLAQAQVTTSAIRGVVQTDAGAGVPNAMVRVTNNATGFTRSVTTDNNGSFNVRNLSVTGTYNVEVTAANFQGERVEDIALSLSNESQLAFELSAETTITDEIIVVAQRMVVADLAIGPNASFGLETLQNAPAINRNIADVIRIDPRVFVDESRGDINSVQCVGQSSRFNSITLDGVALNDSFGLNDNGYPTQRQPFPFDALEQVSVEIAPFDVKYGGFTACNINSVTKSGTNEFHGSAFFDYTDDSLRGKNAGEQPPFDYGDYDEIRYGATFGGPIVKDKLFFFAAYEKLEGANTYPNTSITLGDGPFQITQAEVDEIADIARTVYQYEPGTIPTSNPNFDEKVLLKLDWNISNQHRLSGTFNYNDGNNIVRSDGDSDELEFSNHLYERGARLLGYSGALYSDWTDNFSTELRASYIDLDNRQIPEGGTDFGEFRISADEIDVYLGADDSRQANQLNYEQLSFSFRGNYAMGNHNILFGAERQDLDVFNLFIQQAETEVRFNSIADFRNGIASQVEYNNAPSQNPADAAADWGFATNTLFIQDEWDVTDSLTIIAGLRYDWYASNDVPTENPDFVADYGFSNAQNFDGVDLLQPRLGFTYEASDTLQLRGGLGKYSGGNPNVWLSNNYSANNITQVGARIRGNIDLFALNYTLAEDGVPNAPGWAVPQTLADDVATGQGRNFEINYLDPDFQIPSDWKYSLGATWTPDFNTGEDIFGGAWMFQADLLWSQSEDTAIIKRGDLVESGTQSINGVTYPVFSSPLLDSFVLTNSVESNRAFVASIGASKRWENGWSARFGYAYSDAQDVQPMNSAVAFSNYNNRAYTNPQEEILSTSNYNTKHRFTSAVSYEKDFWTDYDTRFDVFFQSQSGQPYSLTQDNAARGIYGFTPFLGNSGDSILLPGAERNGERAPSWTKIDFRVSQELPGLRKGDRSEIFMVIDNLTNLINDDWGVLQQASFPGTVTPGQPLSINQASTYEIRFGARYDF